MPGRRRLPAPHSAGQCPRSRLASSWDHELLTRLNLVGVAQLVAVGFEDLHVLAGGAVEFAADFGKRIARFYGIAALALTASGVRAHGLRRLRGSLSRRSGYVNIRDQVR